MLGSLIYCNGHGQCVSWLSHVTRPTYRVSWLVRLATSDTDKGDFLMLTISHRARAVLKVFKQLSMHSLSMSDEVGLVRSTVEREMFVVKIFS